MRKKHTTTKHSITATDTQWRKALESTLRTCPQHMAGYTPNKDEMRQIMAHALGWFRATLEKVVIYNEEVE